MHSGGGLTSSTSVERFAVTRWSMVAAAAAVDGASPVESARRALLELCLRYSYPVYAFVRDSGHPAAVAQDITRAFFEELLQRRPTLDEMRSRGRFRKFLLESLISFLGTDWRRAREHAPVAEFEQPRNWDELEALHQREVSVGRTPEQTYQRSYALEVLGSALARLRREAEQADRLQMFEAMESLLSAEPAPGELEELASRLGLRPLATLVALKRLRQRYRELAESELAETVANAQDLEDERAALIRALGPG